MRCVNCGYEYFSKETLENGVCPACGRSLTVTDQTYHPKSATEVGWAKTSPLGFDPALQVDAAVSSAINIRRIALAVILGVILLVGTLLTNLMISVGLTDDYGNLDMGAARILLASWLLLALGIVIYGLFVIVYKKKLSRP